LTVGKPDVAPPVVPGSELFGGRFKHVSQGSRPEAGKQLGVLAVDDEQESGRHRGPIGSAVAWALARMTPTADTNECGRDRTYMDARSAPCQPRDSVGLFVGALQASDHTAAGVGRSPTAVPASPLTGIGPLRPSARCPIPQLPVHLDRSRPIRSRAPPAPG